MSQLQRWQQRAFKAVMTAVSIVVLFTLVQTATSNELRADEIGREKAFKALRAERYGDGSPNRDSS